MTEKQQIYKLEKMLGKTVRMLDKIVFVAARRPITDNKSDVVFLEIQQTINSVTERLEEIKSD